MKMVGRMVDRRRRRALFIATIASVVITSSVGAVVFHNRAESTEGAVAPIDCRQAGLLFSRLAEGCSDPCEIRQLRAHVQCCPLCQKQHSCCCPQYHSAFHK